MKSQHQINSKRRGHSMMEMVVVMSVLAGMSDVLPDAEVAHG